MKKLLPLFSGLLLIVFTAGAQSQPILTGYYDKNWKQVSKDSATYYRTAEPQGDKHLVRDYYMSGQLQMDPVLCTALKPKLMFEAVTMLYHENGKAKEKGLFINEERSGLHTYWYDNGTLQQELEHLPENKHKLHQYYSRDGKPLLLNGSGIITDEKSENVFREYKDSVMIASYLVEGDDTFYYVAEQPAEYKGGMSALLMKLQQNVRYPQSARSSGVSGRVFVKFVVDEEGKSTRHEVLKGVSAALDAEALRVSKMLNRWNPAKHAGKKVKSVFVLPVAFRIEH
jgi:TonB family protein